MALAKIFTHGGSQAVRLPKEFRFDVPVVHVRKVGREIVLSAVPEQGAEALIDALSGFDPAAPLVREQPADQQRDPVRRER